MRASGSPSATSDFGKAGTIGRFQTVTPVCIDTLGETWAGYVTDGTDAGRTVLITVLEYPADSLPARPILQAARSAIGVRHPNLLAFLDAAPAEEAVGLVSEYLPGEPLSALLRASTNLGIAIPDAVALAIVRDAVFTLNRLRASDPKAIGHGALCPETIFVASFGETMLRHPGLQSAAMKMMGFRRHPACLGYHAPEYLLDPRENEESADVFSAGVLLWEMMAGRPLFGERDHTRTSRVKRLTPEQAVRCEERLSSMPIPSIGHVGRSSGALHPDVMRLVDWCLCRDPASRPQTLADLHRALISLPLDCLAMEPEVAHTVRRLAGPYLARREELLGALAGNASAAGPVPGAITKAVPRSGEHTITAVASLEDRFDQTTRAHGRRGLQELDTPFPERKETAPESEHNPPAVVAIRDHSQDSHTKGGWLLAAVALLAAGGIASYVLLEHRTGAEAASSGGTELTPPQEVHQPRAKAVEADASSTTPPTQHGTLPDPSEGPKTDTTATEAKAAPARTPRSTAPAKKKPSPTGPYRPQGI